MFDINILDFFKNGGHLNEIHLNDPIEKVIQICGNPIEKIGDKVCGFLHYSNGVRFGYFDDEIDELAIVFFGNISIKYDINCDHLTVINEKSTINEIIYLLNASNIAWKGNDEKNINVFSIKLNNNIYILFDLLTGFLTKISLSR